MSDAASFASALRTARRSAYRTQREFADVLGVPQGTVGRWESGIRVPRPEMMERIADVLSLSPSDLWDEAPAERQSRSPDEIRREVILILARAIEELVALGGE